MPSDAKASPPWPVYVLVLSSVGGLAWSTLVDPDRNGWDVAVGLFTLWMTYSLWVGKPWAYSLSFALATLCVAFIVVFVTVHLLRGNGVFWGAVASGIWSLAAILLLLHPATETFRRLHETPRPQRETTG